MLFYIGLFSAYSENGAVFTINVPSIRAISSDLVLTRYRQWILDLDVITWSLRAVMNTPNGHDRCAPLRSAHPAGLIQESLRSDSIVGISVMNR